MRCEPYAHARHEHLHLSRELGGGARRLATRSERPMSVVTTRLTPEVVQALDQIAEVRRRSRAEVVRESVGESEG